MAIGIKGSGLVLKLKFYPLTITLPKIRKGKRMLTLFRVGVYGKQFRFKLNHTIENQKVKKKL